MKRIRKGSRPLQGRKERKMDNTTNRLPEGASVTLLVSEDTEFLTGRLLEFAASDAAGAVKAYDEVAKDARGIAGIGYRICLDKNEPLLDRTYFFWPDEDPSLDCSDDYLEVREAMEGVLAILRGTVKTVKVFARIGITLEMPIKAYELMKARAESKSCPGCYGDLDLDVDEIRAFLKYGNADGDSYVPGCVFDEVEEGLKEEKRNEKTE